jgi:hypothetical protein
MGRRLLTRTAGVRRENRHAAKIAACVFFPDYTNMLAASIDPANE